MGAVSSWESLVDIVTISTSVASGLFQTNVAKATVCVSPYTYIYIEVPLRRPQVKK